VVTGDDRLGSGGEGAGWSASPLARGGVDQRNLRSGPPPSGLVEDRREMQSSMRPARPRARLRRRQCAARYRPRRNSWTVALDVGLGHPEFSRPTGTVALKRIASDAPRHSGAAPRGETSVFVAFCLASRSASRNYVRRERERADCGGGLSAVLAKTEYFSRLLRSRMSPGNRAAVWDWISSVARGRSPKAQRPAISATNSFS